MRKETPDSRSSQWLANLARLPGQYPKSSFALGFAALSALVYIANRSHSFSFNFGPWFMRKENKPRDALAREAKAARDVRATNQDNGSADASGANAGQDVIAEVLPNPNHR